MSADSRSRRQTWAVLHTDSVVPVLLSLVIRATAVTIGRHVFVRRGVTADERLLRHEQVHVEQFAELGLLRFGWLYARDFVAAWLELRDRRWAYRAIRFEQEARALEMLPVPWREVGLQRAPMGWMDFTLPKLL